MPAEPIRFYHRYHGRHETENIYGEKWLRLMYENPTGKFLLWLLVRRAIFSRYYGWQMNKRMSAGRILPFIVEYDLNPEEFAKSPFDFKSFNEFFYRALKKEARPINPDPNVVVFAADGRHLGFQNIDLADGFYAKGGKFTLAELLDSEEQAAPYAGGTLLISRLCPVDYHRFHFCVSGKATEAELIRGPLFSVSPIALRRRVDYLVRNKRVKTFIDTERFGRVVQMEIGATNVGSIKQTYLAERPVEKGEEKGLFKFGGSCVVTLFEPGRLQLEPDLVRESQNYTEVYAHMGDRLGTALRAG